jgi:hypothetical protein
MRAVQFETVIDNGIIQILSKKIPETMLMSEKTLAKDWDNPEEDEAWKIL